MDTRPLPVFSCGDLVAVLIKYNEGKVEKSIVVCSAYLPFDSEASPRSREFEELIRHCEAKDLHLVIWCDSSSHHMVCGSTNCSDRGVALFEFLNSSNLEILNQGNDPTVCNNRQLEVTDITLGSVGLIESFKS
jgi:hypothetical protein